ncbi:MAG: LytTR family DNA-binding domain-containing protein [Lachnospiraceae bacterium]
MQIEIKIDPNCKETKIIILADKMTDEVNEIAKKLSKKSPQIIVCMKDDTVKILDQANIFRAYSADKKVFAATNSGEYIVRLRLFELEERLDKNDFVRISNSEIINIKKVKNFDLSFAGTICVSLLDGTVTYVSRRYVTKIKQLLGI